jgi:hypothetical protein
MLANPVFAFTSNDGFGFAQSMQRAKPKGDMK